MAALMHNVETNDGQVQTQQHTQRYRNNRMRCEKHPGFVRREPLPRDRAARSLYRADIQLD